MWLQADGKYEFKQISWTTHPAYLPQFMNGITFSFPFIAEQRTLSYMMHITINRTRTTAHAHTQSPSSSSSSSSY
jgi:hypothetical protein